MRRRRRGRFGRAVARTVLLLVAAVAFTVAWLDRRGLPDFARDRLHAAIRNAGLDVDFTGLRLDLPNGVEASDVRVFEGPVSRRPRVEVAVVRIGIRWMELLRRRPALGGLEIRDGTLLLGPDEGSGGEFITGIRADLQLRGETLDVGAMSGVWRGISIRALGRIVMTRGADGRLVPPALLPPRDRRPDGTPSFDPARLPLVFPGGGRIEARIDLDAAAPDRATVALRGEGGPLQWRGVPFDGWSLSARLAGQGIVVDEVAVLAGAERMVLSGSFSPADATAEVRLSGAVPAAHVAVLPLPPKAANIHTGLGLRSADPIRLDLTLGPGPWTSLVHRVRGRVSVSRTELLGVWLESLSVAFDRDGPSLRLTSVDGIVGRDAMAGPVHLDGGLDLPSGDYEGRARTGFNPHALMPWLDPGQSVHVGALAFRSVAPTCTATVRGRIGDIGCLVLDGTIAARDFLYNGALLASATARLQVSNQVMRMSDVRASRPEGALIGWIEQDFRRRMLRFDIDSSIDPFAAARLCGPAPHRFVSHIRSEGPARIQARGQADYGERRDNDVTFAVKARSAGMGWLLLDGCEFRGRVLGRHIAISNMSGAVYGGTFEGDAAFDLPDGQETRTRYRVKGRFDNTDFTAALRAVTDRIEQSHEGRLSGTADLTGFVGVGQGHTATGRGTIHIEDGRLLEIPIFGGFSRHLARIIPGVAFTSQSDFHSVFRIARGRAVTEQAELQGALLTMQARGAYGFDRSLDFVVEAKLLRKGLIAEVVRLLTLPVTKLLEYDLTGTLSAPQWIPRNMPKELLPATDKGDGGADGGRK